MNTGGGWLYFLGAFALLVLAVSWPPLAVVYLLTCGALLVRHFTR